MGNSLRKKVLVSQKALEVVAGEETLLLTLEFKNKTKNASYISDTAPVVEVCSGDDSIQRESHWRCQYVDQHRCELYITIKGRLEDERAKVKLKLNSGYALSNECVFVKVLDQGTSEDIGLTSSSSRDGGSRKAWTKAGGKQGNVLRQNEYSQAYAYYGYMQGAIRDYNVKKTAICDFSTQHEDLNGEKRRRQAASLSKERDTSSTQKEHDTSSTQNEHDTSSTQKEHNTSSAQKEHDTSSTQKEHDTSSKQKEHDTSSAKKEHDKSSTPYKVHDIPLTYQRNKSDVSQSTSTTPVLNNNSISSASVTNTQRIGARLASNNTDIFVQTTTAKQPSISRPRPRPIERKSTLSHPLALKNTSASSAVNGRSSANEVNASKNRASERKFEGASTVPLSYYSPPIHTTSVVNNTSKPTSHESLESEQLSSWYRLFVSEKQSTQCDSLSLNDSRATSEDKSNGWASVTNQHQFPTRPDIFARPRPRATKATLSNPAALKNTSLSPVLTGHSSASANEVRVSAATKNTESEKKLEATSYHALPIRRTGVSKQQTSPEPLTLGQLACWNDSLVSRSTAERKTIQCDLSSLHRTPTTAAANSNSSCESVTSQDYSVIQPTGYSTAPDHFQKGTTAYQASVSSPKATVTSPNPSDLKIRPANRVQNGSSPISTSKTNATGNTDSKRKSVSASAVSDHSVSKHPTTIQMRPPYSDEQRLAFGVNGRSKEQPFKVSQPKRYFLSNLTFTAERSSSNPIQSDIHRLYYHTWTIFEADIIDHYGDQYATDVDIVDVTSTSYGVQFDNNYTASDGSLRIRLRAFYHFLDSFEMFITLRCWNNSAEAVIKQLVRVNRPADVLRIPAPSDPVALTRKSKPSYSSALHSTSGISVLDNTSLKKQTKLDRSSLVNCSADVPQKPASSVPGTLTSKPTPLNSSVLHSTSRTPVLDNSCSKQQTSLDRSSLVNRSTDVLRMPASSVLGAVTKDPKPLNSSALHSISTTPVLDNSSSKQQTSLDRSSLVNHSADVLRMPAPSVPSALTSNPKPLNSSALHSTSTSPVPDNSCSKQQTSLDRFVSPQRRHPPFGSSSTARKVTGGTSSTDSTPTSPPPPPPPPNAKAVKYRSANETLGGSISIPTSGVKDTDNPNSKRKSASNSGPNTTVTTPLLYPPPSIDHSVIEVISPVHCPVKAGEILVFKIDVRDQTGRKVHSSVQYELLVKLRNKTIPANRNNPTTFQVTPQCSGKESVSYSIDGKAKTWQFDVLPSKPSSLRNVKYTTDQSSMDPSFRPLNDRLYDDVWATLEADIHDKFGNVVEDVDIIGVSGTSSGIEFDTCTATDGKLKLRLKATIPVYHSVTKEIRVTLKSTDSEDETVLERKVDVDHAPCSSTFSRVISQTNVSTVGKTHKIQVKIMNVFNSPVARQAGVNCIVYAKTLEPHFRAGEYNCCDSDVIYIAEDENHGGMVQLDVTITPKRVGARQVLVYLNGEKMDSSEANFEVSPNRDELQFGSIRRLQREGEAAILEAKIEDCGGNSIALDTIGDIRLVQISGPLNGLTCHSTKIQSNVVLIEHTLLENQRYFLSIKPDHADVIHKFEVDTHDNIPQSNDPEDKQFLLYSENMCRIIKVGRQWSGITCKGATKRDLKGPDCAHLKNIKRVLNLRERVDLTVDRSTGAAQIRFRPNVSTKFLQTCRELVLHLLRGNHYRKKASEVARLRMVWKERIEILEEREYNSEPSRTVVPERLKEIPWTLKHCRSERNTYGNLMNEYNRQASFELYAFFNYERQDNEVDLHGLFVADEKKYAALRKTLQDKEVKDPTIETIISRCRWEGDEAIRKLEDKLRSFDLESARESGEPWIEIVVGAGHHSRETQKIRPKVENFLRERSTEFAPVNKGSLVVTLEKYDGPEPCFAEYYCQECHRCWRSGQSWSNRPQACENCKVTKKKEVDCWPIKQSAEERSNSNWSAERPTRNRSEMQHKVELCKECKRLGHACYKSKSNRRRSARRANP